MLFFDLIELLFNIGDLFNSFDEKKKQEKSSVIEKKKEGKDSNRAKLTDI
jgi:hypothetical protein